MSGLLTSKLNDEALRWALLMTAVESVGDASLRYSAQTKNNTAYWVGQGAYTTQAHILSLALKNNKLGIVNAYWNGLTNITNGLIGMAMGETYTSYQIAGIGLITAGILIL